MLYCLIPGDSGYYIYRCESEDSIKPQSVSWMTDRCWFESAVFLTAESVQAGQRAVDCFFDSGESEYRNFIAPVGPGLLETERIFIPARGRALSGREVLEEMLDSLGADLRRRYGISGEDRLVIVHPSSIDESTAKGFARCAERLGFGGVSYLPSWYAGLLAQDINLDPGDRLLLVDIDTDESTAAAVMVEESTDGAEFVPRAVITRERTSLSLHSAAQLLLTEVLRDCETYDIARVPDSWGKHDYEVLMREAVRCTKQLLRGQRCDFSACGLYCGGYAGGVAEKDDLRPEFLRDLLERNGWYRRIQELAGSAAAEAGWTGAPVTRVIVTGSAGCAALPVVGAMFPAGTCVTLDDDVQSLAKGALRWKESGKDLPLCRRIWLCCLAVDRAGNSDRWFYTALHSNAAMQIPCHGVQQVYLVLADAVIRDGTMISRTRHRELQRIDIPEENGISLCVTPERQGYTCRISRGRTAIRQETFGLHELWE